MAMKFSGRARTGWMWFAASSGLFTVGSAILALLKYILVVEEVFPSLADVF
jgi:hypothetical protein